MTDQNENKRQGEAETERLEPEGSSQVGCSPSYESLKVFEIHSVRWEDDDHTAGEDRRTLIRM